MIIGTIKADKASAIRSETPARIFETGAYKGVNFQRFSTPYPEAA